MRRFYPLACLLALSLAIGCDAGKKPVEPKPDATKPDATKPDATKPDAAKPAEKDADTGLPDADTGANTGLPDADTIEAKTPDSATPESPIKAAKSGETPDVAMKNFSEGLANHRIEVVWDSLPASYQQDVNVLLAAAGAKMDAEVWNSGFNLCKKAAAVLKNKKEMFLALPFVEKAGVEPEKASKGWDKVVDLFATIANSELSDLKKVQKLDMREFLAGTGSKISKQIATISALSPVDQYAMQMQRIKGSTFTIEESDGDTATVKVNTGDSEESVKMIRIEGKWLPAEMAEDWKEGIEDAKEALANISQEQIDQQKPAVLQQIAMVEGILDQIDQAENQEEFQEVLEQTVIPLLGMFGSGGAAPRPDFDDDAPAPSDDDAPAPKPESDDDAPAPPSSDDDALKETEEASEETEE